MSMLKIALLQIAPGLTLGRKPAKGPVRLPAGPSNGGGYRPLS